MTISDKIRIYELSRDLNLDNKDILDAAQKLSISVKSHSSSISLTDAKKIKNSWKVFINGGRVETGINAIQWAKKVEKLGAGEILLTSMDRDGTKKGFDLELTKKISSSVGIPVIASGGIGKIDHFVEGVIKGGASALLAASVFHFGEFGISEVKKHLISKGINVRMDY